MKTRWMTLPGFLTILGGACTYVLPSLTGRTLLTKMQIAVLVIGGVGNVVTIWLNLLSDKPTGNLPPAP